MNLPTSWNQITVNQFYELEDLKGSITGTELILERLAIILDTDIYDDRIYNLSIDDLFNIRQKLYWLDNDPNINCSDIDFTLKPKKLENLILSEFIDIEHYIYEKNSIHIVSSIYFKNYKTDEWGNNIEEPYIYDINKRSELFLDLPITYVMKYYNRYKIWRDNFLKTYEELFLSDDINDDIENTDLQGLELIQYQKEVLTERMKSKWSWESILLGLSNNDVTKFEKLFETSLILVFNALSARKVLDL